MSDRPSRFNFQKTIVRNLEFYLIKINANPIYINKITKDIFISNQSLNSILEVSYKDMKNNRICLSCKKIDDVNINDIINFSDRFLEIKKICLYGNKITDKGVLILSENKHIEELCLVRNDNVTSAILSSFNKNINFKKIYIDNKHKINLNNDKNIFVFCENAVEKSAKTIFSFHCKNY